MNCHILKQHKLVKTKIEQQNSTELANCNANAAKYMIKNERLEIKNAGSLPRYTK